MMRTSEAGRPGAANADAAEIARFDRLARDWWDPNGPMKPLHRLNPVRLAFVRDAICAQFGRDPAEPMPLAGLAILDVGCGAGLLTEPLARLGARVTGLDLATSNVEVARAHAERGGLEIAYACETIEAVAARGERFDVVTALEVVEHVPDIAGFVSACADAVKPGGLLVMATLNRTLKSLALAVVGAEYVLRWLPPGTHRWDKFVTPDELAGAMSAAGLRPGTRGGIVYDALADAWRPSRDTSINYMIAAAK